MCAAAVTYQEYSVRVIRGGLISLGPGPRPRKEEREQLEDVLRVCRVLQLVVRLGQSIIRNGHREGRVCSKAPCEGAMVRFILTM